MPEVYLGCAIGTAVLFSSLVGDSARGCSIPLQKLKWLHHLSGLWSPLMCCKQIDNCHRTSIAWPHFSVLKRSHLHDKLIIVMGFAILSISHSTSILTIGMVMQILLPSATIVLRVMQILLRYSGPQPCCSCSVAAVTLGLCPLGANSSHNTVRCVRPSLSYLLCADIILAQPCCNLFQQPLLVN